MNPFLEAIKVLDERGWRQGSLQGEDGSVCMHGALVAVVHDYLPLVREITLIMTKVLDGCATGIWNDHPLRTEEDVRLKLKEAAVLWEERRGRHESIS